MKKELHILILILVASLGLYLITLRGVVGNVESDTIHGNYDQPTKPLELSPERGRFTHILALANNDTYSLNQELADIAYPDVAYYKGSFFSYFAPGIPYYAFPFYRVGSNYNLGQAAAFYSVSLISALALLFLYKIARNIIKLPRWASLFTTLTFAFGSFAWSYANTLYQHHLTTFLLLAGFYGVWKFRTQRKTGALWAIIPWLAYALGIFIDYPNAILLLPVMVYLLITSIQIKPAPTKIAVDIRIGAMVAGIAFILITGFHFWHNEHYFGSWKQLAGGLLGYKQILDYGVLDAPNPEAAIEELAKQKHVIAFFSERNLPKGFMTLLFSIDRGLFMYAPIAIVGVVGLWMRLRKKITLEIGILISILLTHIFLYSSWGDPWGGWAFGPRYLIPSLSILSLFVGMTVYALRQSMVARVVTFILFIYSSAVGLLGALTTNAVPPQHEAIALNSKFNYLHNLAFLMDNKSSSIVYNTFLSENIPLLGYYLLIIIPIIIFGFVLLFTNSRNTNAS